MAHFAKLDTDETTVLSVVVVADKDWQDENGDESEEAGQRYMTKRNGWPAALWKQTSYNTQAGVHRLGGTPLRKNYAGIGYTYDTSRNAFIPPKPFPSFVLNEDTCCWDNPVATPDTDNDHRALWNEGTLSWDIVEVP